MSHLFRKTKSAWQGANLERLHWTKKIRFFARLLLILSLMSRIDHVSINLLANYFRNFSKKDLTFNCLLSEKYRRNSKFRKNRKSNNNVKRLSNKYGKNSKNNKFNKILHLEREKVKKGFEKFANFAKIAKVTRLFLAMWKDWVINTVCGPWSASKSH